MFRFPLALTLLGWSALAAEPLKIAVLHPLLGDLVGQVGGDRVETIDLAAQTVTFVRAPRRRAAYTVRKSGDTVLWDADLIKALRAYMNLNQSQFAEHMGVRQQTVSEWEVGTYEPTRATCKYLMLVAEKAGFRYSESDSA